MVSCTSPRDLIPSMAKPFIGGFGRLALLGMATSHFTVFLYFGINIPFATLTGNQPINTYTRPYEHLVITY